MKVFIPNHLKNLEIIDQLDKMIKEYSNYYIGDINSFNDYYYSLKSDPVKKFISICIKEGDISDNQEYEQVINYLSRLFYSVKGTIKVFDYMKSFLGLTFEGDIVYSTKYIEFKLSGLSLNDEKQFNESLIKFLDSLLYYQELKVNIDTIDLNLTGEINNYISTNVNTFNKFIAEIYESNN